MTIPQFVPRISYCRASGRILHVNPLGSLVLHFTLALVLKCFGQKVETLADRHRIVRLRRP
jgi:hypothetical protein